MKRFIFLFLLIISQLELISQVNEYGIPLLTNYTMKDYDGNDQNWCIVQDNRGLIYIGNIDNGVLEYDGETWRKIPISNNSYARSLAIDKEGTVYVGAIGEFGYLMPDELGEMKYISLAKQLDSTDREFNNIEKVYVFGSRVYFVHQTKIFHYHNKILKSVHSRPPNGLMGFRYDYGLYTGSYTEGLHLLKDTSFVEVPGSDYFKGKSIFVMLPYVNNKALMGTTDKISKLILLDVKTGEIDENFFNAFTRNQIKDSYLYNGYNVSDGQVVLSTINKGAYIINNSGEIDFWLNKQYGLQNQTVINVYYNEEQNSQLWLALNNGIAKAEIASPIRKFSEESGFTEAILDVIEFKDRLYIATFAGMFYLDYEEQMPVFNKIEGLEGHPWTFLEYINNGNKKLIIGSSRGIYELRNNKAVNLEDQCEGLEKGFRFYCFKIAASENDKSRIYIGDKGGLAFLNYRNGRWYADKRLMKDFSDEIRSIQEDNNGNIWIGTTYKGVIKVLISDTDTSYTRYDKGSIPLNNNQIYQTSKGLVFATEKGFYHYNSDNDQFERDNLFPPEYSDGSKGIWRLAEDSEGNFWLSVHNQERKWIERILSQDGNFKVNSKPFNRFPNEQPEVIYHTDDSISWIGISNVLYSFNRNYKKEYTRKYHTLIRKVIYGEDSLLFAGTNYEKDAAGNYLIGDHQPENLNPILKYHNNAITFFYAAPYFESEERLEYSYILEGYNDQWSKWSEKSERGYTNLNKGKYTFRVKAKNLYDVESEEAIFEFSILPPWYQTIVAYISYFILAVLVVYVIVKLYTRRLEQEKIRLEGIVKERTAEVVAQKDEIEKQRDQIQAQKEGIEDSILYASRIQRALLPGEGIRNVLPDHFVLFKPRDIVSGDFYWMANIGDKSFIVAADCTGHGVPGAFMSMLGMSFLNEVIVKSEIKKTDEILNKVRDNVISSLKQTGKLDEAKDGMDLALYIWDKKTNEVEYSGANNPLYYIRPLNEEELDMIKNEDESFLEKGAMHNGKYILNQIKADKMPIGIYVKSDIPFKSHVLKVEPGYSLYTFSDGYVDQFGEIGKKFMTKQFKKLLLEIQEKPMNEQHDILDKAIEDWMTEGEKEQVDDILVFGVKI